MHGVFKNFFPPPQRATANQEVSNCWSVFKHRLSGWFQSFYSANADTPRSPSWFSKTFGTQPVYSRPHRVPVATPATDNCPLTSLTLTKHPSGCSDPPDTYQWRASHHTATEPKNPAQKKSTLRNSFSRDGMIQQCKWVSAGSESDDEGCSALKLVSSKPTQWTSFTHRGWVSGESTSNMFVLAVSQNRQFYKECLSILDASKFE